AIGEIAKSRGIEVKILKQTRAANQRQGNRTSLAESYLKSILSIEQRYYFPIIHDKFLIVDDSILVTTANFTSTQFAWAENYNMKYYNEKENIDFSINNTFSDINSFHFINSKDVTNKYLKHFNTLWDISEIV
ncbi:hypothetical protein U5N28_19305, partial [Lysinibacillus telephonicus]|uniref:phospholipase D-like domain-containing protein n=1 Tax=Lysinibacillus telephonicus TaxID=1714840 RepID=UPI00397847B8